MLVGREPERQRIAQLTAAARLGQSGVLVVRGEAGIGKTALLEDTAERANDMALLRAAGTEAESGLAFAGLTSCWAQHYISSIACPSRNPMRLPSH